MKPFLIPIYKMMLSISEDGENTVGTTCPPREYKEKTKEPTLKKKLHEPPSIHN
jgi:hypothetical protein